MERILTNEYLSYEQGYFDGKNDAILQFSSEDEEVEFDEEYDDDLDEMDCNEKWYNMGYEDAKEYYFQKCLESKDIDELLLDGEEMVDDFFTERVIEFNSLENDPIPIGVFKIRR